jgi:hypothetical protein
MLDQIRHQRGGETAPLVRRIGAHRADLGRAVDAQTLARHRDQPSGRAHAEVQSELVRARDERPGRVAAVSASIASGVAPRTSIRASAGLPASRGHVSWKQGRRTPPPSPRAGGPRRGTARRSARTGQLVQRGPGVGVRLVGRPANGATWARSARARPAPCAKRASGPRSACQTALSSASGADTRGGGARAEEASAGARPPAGH